MLLNSVPEEGWQLLVRAYPSSHGFVVIRHPPAWRPWAQDGAHKPTVGEHNVFVKEMDRLLIENVGTDAGRWADLVGIISSLSPESRQRATELLSQHTDTLRQHPACDSLWSKLREQLHHHNSYPDADWAMEPTDLEALNVVYRQLTPSDPTAAHAWTFDNWPDLPEGKPSEYSESTERIAEDRQMAVRVAYESGGVSAILGIAEAAEEPHEVGVAVALGIDPELALDLAIKHLGSTDPKLGSMAYGGLRALFLQSGWKTLDETITTAKASESTPQMLADIYLVAPAARETWDRLADESEEVRTAYWKSIRWANTSEWDAEDLDFAVQRLLSVRRSVDSVNWLTFQPIPHELVIQLLEAVPLDVAAASDFGMDVDAYRIADLFKRLDQSKDVSDDTIARLEIPYIGILDYDRPQLALHREVTREPSLFADVITWAFKRADGQADESVDDQVRERQALFAYNILWNLHLLPGLIEDGSVDSEALSTWVNEARRMCRERDRKDIGDQQIGQILANAPVGEDGVWPCEPVRDLLDDLTSRHLGTGFTTGKRNLRGVTSRGAFDGGIQERSLADGYRQDAATISARWPFTARLLHELADSYDFEAKLEDQRADWSDRFES